MKYIFAGILTGALLSLIFLQGESGSELVPVFHSSLEELQLYKEVGAKSLLAEIVLSSEDSTRIIDEKGFVRKTIPANEGLFEFSGHGSFYAKYSSTGRDIELFGIDGQRYWKIDSRRKPFLSANGHLIFLLASDHSSIRIIDQNGTPGAQEFINGRLCTVIEFSTEKDFGACGFADGSYYFINEKGEVIYSGFTPPGSVVKGIGISSNGLYGSVHFGNTENDFLAVIGLEQGRERNFSLSNIHSVKTSIMVSDKGDTVFFDMNSVIALNNSGKLKFKIDVPAKKPGFSAMSAYNGVLTLSYTGSNGSGRFILFSDKGNVFYSREFPDESFLDVKILNDFIFLRGSESLSVYNFLRAENL